MSLMDELHPKDRYIARIDEDAATNHIDIGYVVDLYWLVIGHYYPGEAGLLLGELTVQPLTKKLRDAALVEFNDTVRAPGALGPADRPSKTADSNMWRWDRAVAALPRRPEEIYARLVRHIPFAEMAVAAAAARKGYEVDGTIIRDAKRDGYGRLTDAARWDEEADLYASLGTGESITEARKTYLRAAILFEQFREANQVRYQIARAMGLDASDAAHKKHAESKVRALLDGARRHRYLLPAGVSGRTAGGLTPLGRELAAQHFPDLLKGTSS